jgi:NADH:ubiquinone oxidoreductase subunit K
MLFIEVMYTGLFLYFILISILINMPIGQIFALIILISAACESVIGLGILLILFRYDNSILFKNFAELRG